MTRDKRWVLYEVSIHSVLGEFYFVQVFMEFYDSVFWFFFFLKEEEKTKFSFSFVKIYLSFAFIFLVSVYDLIYV